MSYACKIIADSISVQGNRLTTFEVTYPRMVLAEFNTHRLFSRNSASSRAIPVDKQIARLLEDPFIPIYWGKNQKGMQADEELSEEVQVALRETWLVARDNAIASAKILMDAGVHKQITNRLLEPFMWHTVIVTATDWSNYFNLRDHEMAQPEIQRIASMMKTDLAASKPFLLSPTEWHLPYAQPGELEELGVEKLVKLCCARCARVSYLTHDGKRDISADFTLYNRLLDGGHMSPFEHVARPMTDAEYSKNERLGNFKGWVQHRKEIYGEEDMHGHRNSNA
jgi:thymidylate synthase ThyX